jgi:hypothetical protein
MAKEGLPSRVAEALGRVRTETSHAGFPEETVRPRAVVVAADLPGLARAVERCAAAGYHLEATTADPATAVRMLAAGRCDVVIAGTIADLPQMQIADQPRTWPMPQRVPAQRTEEVGAPLRRRRPQPVRAAAAGTGRA